MEDKAKFTKDLLDIISSEDREVADIIESENVRQRTSIRLIPSENYSSAPVSAALATSFGDKYSEGYPHMWSKEGEKLAKNGKYYQGQQYANQIENLCMKRALELFDLDDNEYHANVQPLSGAPANLAVIGGLVGKDECLLGMSLATGGHLTHGHPVNFTGRLFNAHQYGLGADGKLDYDAIERQAMELKPKLIIAGHSAYPLELDFARFADIAKKCGAYLMVDIAHISGLCSSGQHMSPFPHADIVTTTTHKILRGPRGGMIYCRKSLGPIIDKAIIPGLQGGPHLNNIAALAIALKEAKTPEYKAYAEQVIKNAHALAENLKSLGITLVHDGTENHLMLIDLKPLGLDGTAGAEALERVDIVCNKNSIPGDDKPWKPTGLRIGTPAITTLGMREAEMETLAKIIDETLRNADNEEVIQACKIKAKNLMANFDPKGNLII